MSDNVQSTVASADNGEPAAKRKKVAPTIGSKTELAFEAAIRQRLDVAGDDNQTLASRRAAVEELLTFTGFRNRPGVEKARLIRQCYLHRASIVRLIYDAARFDIDDQMIQELRDDALLFGVVLRILYNDKAKQAALARRLCELKQSTVSSDTTKKPKALLQTATTSSAASTQEDGRHELSRIIDSCVSDAPTADNALVHGILEFEHDNAWNQVEDSRRPPIQDLLTLVRDPESSFKVGGKLLFRHWFAKSKIMNRVRQHIDNLANELLDSRVLDGEKLAHLWSWVKTFWDDARPYYIGSVYYVAVRSNATDMIKALTEQGYEAISLRSFLATIMRGLEDQTATQDSRAGWCSALMALINEIINTAPEDALETPFDRMGMTGHLLLVAAKANDMVLFEEICRHHHRSELVRLSEIVDTIMKNGNRAMFAKLITCHGVNMDHVWRPFVVALGGVDIGEADMFDLILRHHGPWIVANRDKIRKTLEKRKLRALIVAINVFIAKKTEESSDVVRFVQESLTSEQSHSGHTQNVCVICDEPAHIVMVQCGHQNFCVEEAECFQTYFNKQHKTTCPTCRAQLNQTSKWFTRIY